NGKKIAKGQILTKELLSKKIARAEINQGKLLDRFVQNTLEYARREKGIILGSLTMPKLQTVIRDRHVLVVVRGKNYREDLKAIMHYIDEVKPVLIGVDGGADALWEFGYRADIVIGDMDSVGDEALQNAAELVVHAYPDGRAPGMERVKKLGLEAKIFSAPGTSEDVAMLLAYENKAELIVALGTHSSMVDFLEKGRAGMASTFLVRLKVGEKLVDARGVSQLYRKTANYRFVAPLLIAALLPIAVLAALSPWVQHMFKLIMLRLRFSI
ncbi:MAG: putative cytokinetic ring protein SteA, partial [Dethiobacteria bacterium]